MSSKSYFLVKNKTLGGAPKYYNSISAIREVGGAKNPQKTLSPLPKKKNIKCP